MNKRNRPIGQISSELEGDSSLRDLFHSVGYESAPPHMEDAVISRLQMEKDGALSPAGPLIPTSIWIGIGAFAIFASLYVLYLPEQADDHPISDWLHQFSVPEFQVMLPPVFFTGEHVLPLLIFILPCILLQFFLIKNFHDGRYSR